MSIKKEIIDVIAKEVPGRILGKSIKKVPVQVLKKTIKNVPGTQLLEGLMQVKKAHTEYQVVREQEITKRLEILSSRDISLEKIRAQRDLIKTFVDATFDERKQALTAQIKVLDRALEKGDTATLKFALDAMVNTIKSSPFESIADMRAQLDSKDFVLRLE